MKFDDIVKLVGALPCFDLALLVQAFDDRREAIRVQLSRWMKQGKVIGLRRGMYTLCETYRRAPVTPAVLANQLYRPAYLSSLWALGHHDLIPERVVRFTSVTSRVPHRFENPFGVFDYRNIKQRVPRDTESRSLQPPVSFRIKEPLDQCVPHKKLLPVDG